MAPKDIQLLPKERMDTKYKGTAKIVG